MDAVLGFLNNPILLVAIGIVIKFVPGVRTFIANDLIGAITALLAWLGQLVAPAEAALLGGPLAISAGFLGGGVGFFGGLAAALWSAAQAFLVHNLIVRPFEPKRPDDSKRFVLAERDKAAAVAEPSVQAEGPKKRSHHAHAWIAAFSLLLFAAPAMAQPPGYEGKGKGWVAKVSPLARRVSLSVGGGGASYDAALKDAHWIGIGWVRVAVKVTPRISGQIRGVRDFPGVTKPENRLEVGGELKLF